MALLRFRFHGPAQAILSSFEPQYRAIIKALPPELAPCTTVHGKHSYTKAVEGARCEILLRAKALKVKTKVGGARFSGGQSFGSASFPTPAQV